MGKKLSVGQPRQALHLVGFLKVLHVCGVQLAGAGAWHVGGAFPHRFTREEIQSLL